MGKLKEKTTISKGKSGRGRGGMQGWPRGGRRCDVMPRAEKKKTKGAIDQMGVLEELNWVCGGGYPNSVKKG